MMERFGNWISVSALVLAACGGVEDAGSLEKSRAALASNTAPATAGASSLPPGGERSCARDADCAPGQECESEHGRYYCAPHHEDKEYYGADAGAPDPEQHGEDCYAQACGDAGACEDDHHGDEYADEHGGHDDDEYEDDDRSGSNRGPH